MKKIRKKWLSASVLTALGAGSLAAVDARAEGSYVGVGLGDSLISSDRSIRDDYVEKALMHDGFGFTNGSSSVSTSPYDPHACGWRFYYGYKFIPQFAVEAEYADLGKGRSNVKATVDGPEGVSGGHEFQNKGFGVAVIGILPVKGKFSLSAKLGGFRWTAETFSNLKVAALTPTRVKASTSRTGTSADFGLGAQYDFAAQFGGRVEWTRYSVDQSYSDLLSLNAMFHF